MATYGLTPQGPNIKRLDVVDEDTIAGFCEGDGKGDDEDE